MHQPLLCSLPYQGSKQHSLHILTGFKVDAFRMYLSIHVFLGLGGGGISGDSMVPMLRPGLLNLSSEGWDKIQCFPQLPGESLSVLSLILIFLKFKTQTDISSYQHTDMYVGTFSSPPLTQGI